MINKKHSGGILASALVAVLALPGVSDAAAAFEQAPANGNDAYSSISVNQTADNFILAANEQVNGFTWWGSYSADPAGLSADLFQARLFQDNGAGEPQTSAFSSLTGTLLRTATGLQDATGATVYRYDLSLASPLALSGGTSYFLSVVNGFDVNDPNANWYWLLSDASGSNFFRFADADPWQGDTTGNLAFTITVANSVGVPEPAVVWLWLSGFASLGAFAIRRRQE